MTKDENHDGVERALQRHDFISQWHHHVIEVPERAASARGRDTDDDEEDDDDDEEERKEQRRHEQTVYAGSLER